MLYSYWIVPKKGAHRHISGTNEVFTRRHLTVKHATDMLVKNEGKVLLAVIYRDETPIQLIIWRKPEYVHMERL